MSLVTTEALWFARGAHAGQKYGDDPYDKHLMYVAVQRRVCVLRSQGR